VPGDTMIYIPLRSVTVLRGGMIRLIRSPSHSIRRRSAPLVRKNDAGWLPEGIFLLSIVFHVYKTSSFQAPNPSAIIPFVPKPTSRNQVYRLEKKNGLGQPDSPEFHRLKERDCALGFAAPNLAASWFTHLRRFSPDRSS